LGGVANEVIHHAEKPVLLVKMSDYPDEMLEKSSTGDLTDHILFPTDFSENAKNAFEYVKKIVSSGTKKVTLMHVQDLSRIPSDRLAEFNRVDDNRLQELKKTLEAGGCREIDSKILHGSPSVEIIRLVREQKIPLVVMGSQGRGFVKELFLGSVSHNVARHAPASVLLVPANR
jgi:nucleotide-binding universal stress UspA family protein